MDDEFMLSKPGEAVFTPIIVMLAQVLTRHGYRLGLAESCTGGLIGSLCTDMPGSSRWFAGGVIAYADEVKNRLLNVPLDLLHRHGAVSEPVAQYMAAGALQALGADVSIAVSGVAGPDGGSKAKPVGTVWMGFAIQKEIRTQLFFFNGDRPQIRLAAAKEGMLTLIRYIESDKLHLQ